MATPIPGKFRINDKGDRVPVYADEVVQADDTRPFGVVSVDDAAAPASEENPATTARQPGKPKRGGNK